MVSHDGVDYRDRVKSAARIALVLVCLGVSVGWKSNDET
ncbi:MAG: hypothetical protein RIU67_1846, partial [Actinomycetota bacterium]